MVLTCGLGALSIHYYYYYYYIRPNVTLPQQQRPESPTVTLTWYASKYKVHKLHQRHIPGSFENAPPVEFMYLAFTRMPNESYGRRIRSLFLCLCDVFRTLINSLVCLFPFIWMISNSKRQSSESTVQYTSPTWLKMF